MRRSREESSPPPARKRLKTDTHDLVHGTLLDQHNLPDVLDYLTERNLVHERLTLHLCFETVPPEVACKAHDRLAEQDEGEDALWSYLLACVHERPSDELMLLLDQLKTHRQETGMFAKIASVRAAALTAPPMEPASSTSEPAVEASIDRTAFEPLMDLLIERGNLRQGAWPEWLVSAHLGNSQAQCKLFARVGVKTLPEYLQIAAELKLVIYEEGQVKSIYEPAPSLPPPEPPRGPKARSRPAKPPIAADVPKMPRKRRRGSDQACYRELDRLLRALDLHRPCTSDELYGALAVDYNPDQLICDGGFATWEELMEGAVQAGILGWSRAGTVQVYSLLTSPGTDRYKKERSKAEPSTAACSVAMTVPSTSASSLASDLSDVDREFVRAVALLEPGKLRRKPLVEFIEQTLHGSVKEWLHRAAMPDMSTYINDLADRNLIERIRPHLRGSGRNTLYEFPDLRAEEIRHRETEQLYGPFKLLLTSEHWKSANWVKGSLLASQLYRLPGWKAAAGQVSTTRWAGYAEAAVSKGLLHQQKTPACEPEFQLTDKGREGRRRCLELLEA